MKKMLIVLISFLSINQAVSQESEKVILDKFFEIYKSGPVEALDYIYSTNKWIDGKGDAVKQLKSQLKQYDELVGAYSGEEFLYKAGLGESLISKCLHAQSAFTYATPIFGSIVVKGKFPDATGVSVAAEKKVDFPTFAFPSKPICNIVQNSILLISIAEIV